MPEPLFEEVCDNIRELAHAFRLVAELIWQQVGDPNLSHEELSRYDFAYKKMEDAFFVLMVAAFEKGITGHAKDEGIFRQRLEAVSQDTALTKTGREKVMQIWRDRGAIAHGGQPIWNILAKNDLMSLSDELIEVISKLQTRRLKDFGHWLPD